MPKILRLLIAIFLVNALQAFVPMAAFAGSSSSGPGMIVYSIDWGTKTTTPNTISPEQNRFDGEVAKSVFGSYALRLAGKTNLALKFSIAGIQYQEAYAEDGKLGVLSKAVDDITMASATSAAYLAAAPLGPSAQVAAREATAIGITTTQEYAKKLGEAIGEALADVMY